MDTDSIQQETREDLPPHGLPDQQSPKSSRKKKNLNENTFLTPSNNDTYFADEKVLIPEVDGVSTYRVCLIFKSFLFQG